MDDFLHGGLTGIHFLAGIVGCHRSRVNAGKSSLALHAHLQAIFFNFSYQKLE